MYCLAFFFLLGNLVFTEMMPIPQPIKQLHFRFSTATYELVFRAEDVPSKGYDSYFVTRKNERKFVKNPEVKLIRYGREVPISEGYSRVVSTKVKA